MFEVRPLFRSPSTPPRPRLVRDLSDDPPPVRSLFGQRGTLDAVDSVTHIEQPAPKKPGEGTPEEEDGRYCPPRPLLGKSRESGTSAPDDPAAAQNESDTEPAEGNVDAEKAEAGASASTEGRAEDSSPGHEGNPSNARTEEALAAKTERGTDVPAPAPSAAVSALAGALERARSETEQARDRYVKALGELTKAQEADFHRLEQELADLATEVAREILLREISVDRLYVVRLVEAALRVVVEDEAATVLVAQSDLALLERERPRLEVSRGGGLVRVSVDPGLHPGDCVVQVGRARIDARLSDRLERVRQALHGVDTETES